MQDTEPVPTRTRRASSRAAEASQEAAKAAEDAGEAFRKAQREQQLFYREQHMVLVREWAASVKPEVVVSTLCNALHLHQLESLTREIYNPQHVYGMQAEPKMKNPTADGFPTPDRDN